MLAPENTSLAFDHSQNREIRPGMAGNIAGGSGQGNRPGGQYRIPILSGRITRLFASCWAASPALRGETRRELRYGCAHLDTILLETTCPFGQLRRFSSAQILLLL